MAEGFARVHGSDVLEPHSAGIAPAARISRRARAVMAEKGIALDDGYSTKPISAFTLDDFDVVINLSEYSVPDTSTMVLKRPLRDPLKGDESAFRDVRDDVEELVDLLITHFRLARQWHANPLYSEECAAAL